MENNFYVYVYIDPRNFQEFYYGKGKGGRKDAHLHDLSSDTKKSQTLREIKKQGLSPIIRVIAKNLTSKEALLVEKTLLWKLGKTQKALTNIASGHYSINFRPANTMHTTLNGFDYQNGVYYYNTGHRSWDDMRRYGYISAGGGNPWRREICSFQVGDVCSVYVSGVGYVGVGRVLEKAIPIRDFKVDGVSIITEPLQDKKKEWFIDRLDLDENSEYCEYMVRVKWFKTIDEKDARRITKKSGLFYSQLSKASLDNQPKTIKFLEKEFNLNFVELLQSTKGK